MAELSGHSAAARPAVPLLALVADGDADTRAMYAEYLRLCGFRVEESDDGRDALAKVFAIKPDVIVAEARLPGINGYELCRLLRQDASTRTMPIVIVTTDALTSDRQRAETSGASSFLLKPCLPETLAAELLRIVQRPTEVREQTRATGDPIPAQTVRSEAPAVERRRTRKMSRSHGRGDTTTPPLAAPELICPQCDRPLRYLRSHIGGVSAQNAEQWDYYECAARCGTFQYRQRTRKLRRV